MSPAGLSLPPVGWLARYDRATLGADLRAALTLGVVVVPQAIAYAALAGMPPITGLYAAVAGLTVYAVLGTSGFAAPAPTAIDALLVAAAVAPLADGDPTRYVALAGTLALLSGLLQMAAGALRLGGGLASYVSSPVVVGFTLAAALTIVVSQLPALLGIASAPIGTLRGGLQVLARELGQVQPVAALLAAGCLIALVGARGRLAARVPVPLLVLALAALVAALPALDGDLRLIGDVPQGLPGLDLPSLRHEDLRALLPAAAALALISYLESISATSAFARRAGTRLAANQELLALGGANAASGLIGGFNVAAGFSRGALLYRAGARTPATCLLAAVVVGVALLALTPLLAAIPTVALAATIVAAAATLLNPRTALQIARVRRADLAGLLAAFLATAVFGPVTGLAVGVGASLVLFLRQSARPHFPELGRVIGTTRYRNLTRHHDIATDTAVLLMRLDAPLYFANSGTVVDLLTARALTRTHLRYVVLDASAMSWIDYTGIEALADLDLALGENGVELHLAALRGPPQEVLLRTRRGQLLAERGRLHPDVHAAVAALDLAPDSPLR